MLSIKKAKCEDKNEVMAMVKGFYQSDAVEHEVSMSILERTFDDATSEEEPLAHGVVLWDDNKIIGYGYWSEGYSCEAGGRMVMLEELFIRPEYRSKGLGKQFFDLVFKSHPNAVRFRLEVTKSNKRASALYERLGFEYLNYDQMVYDRK